jgi:hypothetical protein
MSHSVPEDSREADTRALMRITDRAAAACSLAELALFEQVAACLLREPAEKAWFRDSLNKSHQSLQRAAGARTVVEVAPSAAAGPAPRTQRSRASGGDIVVSEIDRARARRALKERGYVFDRKGR